MAIAFDAFTSNGYVGEASPTTWTHTPAGTPRGVIVFVLNNTGNDVTAVTYGGQSLAQVALSPSIKSTGEVSTVYCWFLGTGIPTGNQTVSVTHGGSGIYRDAMCVTVTAASDTAVQDTTIISSDSAENPSGTLSLGGLSCFCAEAFGTGQGGVDLFDALENWTVRVEVDQGVKSYGVYTYNIIGTDDVTFGWTQSADDANCLGIAVKEAAAAPPASSTLPKLANAGRKPKLFAEL